MLIRLLAKILTSFWKRHPPSPKFWFVKLHGTDIFEKLYPISLLFMLELIFVYTYFKGNCYFSSYIRMVFGHISMLPYTIYTFTLSNIIFLIQLFTHLRRLLINCVFYTKKYTKGFSRIQTPYVYFVERHVLCLKPGLLLYWINNNYSIRWTFASTTSACYVRSRMF